MIGYLTGTILHQLPNSLLMDVNGVGYLINVTPTVLSQLSLDTPKTSLYIYTNVKEDDIALYGFMRWDDRECFNLLRTVSGIGPKLAMTILSSSDMTQLMTMIEQNDVSMLTRLPGVGKKTAERMIVELKGKWDKLGIQPTLPSHSKEESNARNDAVSVLSNLGYSQIDINRSLNQLHPGQFDKLEDIVKHALKILQP